MAPTLYMAESSPPVRSVLITAKALGIHLNWKLVNLKDGEHLTPEFLKLNPQHMVPVLVDDDGFTVADSHAINYYLITKYGKGSTLLPTDPKKRATIEQRLHFDSGHLFSEFITLFNPLFRTGAKTWSKASEGIMMERVDMLERILADSEWAAGDSLTVADYSLIATITSVDVAIPIIGNPDYPNITRWVKKVTSLPEYSANVEGLKKFVELVKSITT